MDRFTNLEKNVDNYNHRTYRLDRMTALLDRLGNPQEKYRTIHVAGSKGKGSTCAMISNALIANGHNVGLYTSPHLVDPRERFMVNNRFIEDRILIETAEELAESIKDFRFSKTEWGENEPTTFELYTSFAYILFAKLGCDIAVIETGLGGRLDATNTLNPIACVLTNIELEHTAILGDTIEKIAIEKSKIIRPGVPVFSARQKPEAKAVLKAEAESCGSPVFFLEDMPAEEIHPRMAIDVQKENSALALAVIRYLGEFCEGTISAIENTVLPGRFERISDSPLIYLDSAHTENSLRQTIDAFCRIAPGKRTAIFAVLADKRKDVLLPMVLDAFDTVIISRPGTYKKSDIDGLFAHAKKIRPDNDVRLIPDNIQALKESCAAGSPILVTGSFYLAGQILEAYRKLYGDTH